MSNVVPVKRGRNSAPVHVDSLRSAVLEVEKNGPLESLEILHSRVAKKYAALVNDMNDYMPISSNVVAARIEEFGIEVKTVASKKTATPSNSAKTRILNHLGMMKAYLEMGINAHNKGLLTDELAKAVAIVEGLHTRKPTENATPEATSEAA